MAYWLVKADPDSYGYANLERDGTTRWDGVSNPLALKHMRAVAKGDAVLVYHTGAEKCVTGLARAASGPYPDPEDPSGRLVVFDLSAQRRLKQPVLLAAVKADPRFAEFPLVRMPRLSVMPVPPPLWKRLLDLAGEA